MPGKYGYYTSRKLPRRRVERRIKLPAIEKRAFRFQVRSLIRKEYIHKNPWWFVMHRRGPAGRPKVGEDPLEARAVPHGLVRGTLPERILYAALVALLHFVVEIDFTFQTSLQGGRINFGGIVVDFIFPFLKLVIQVQGPTHDQFIRVRKDTEQMLALADMGYNVIEVEEDLIYDEDRFNNWLLEVFGWSHTGSAGPAANVDWGSPEAWEQAHAIPTLENTVEQPDYTPDDLSVLFSGAQSIQGALDGIFG